MAWGFIERNIQMGVLILRYFEYTNKEINYLKERDPVLGKEIDRIGMVKRKLDGDIFSSLISSIISQQISTKAALTVKERLTKLIGSMTPENIAKTGIEDIQKCGMTMRKAVYIKGIARAEITGEIDFNNLSELADGEVVKVLTSLKGVGEWTVEMLLIHSLQRPNIISYKDLGIQRGLKKLYKLDDLSKKEFSVFQDRYSPYCTVASIYLWEIGAQK